MMKTITKKFMVVLAAALLIGVNLIAFAGMKDIELTPGKATNEGNMIKTFPTVADAQVTVHFFFETDDMVTLRVFDLQGRVMATDQGYVPRARTHESIIDASSLANGIYFVKLSQANGTTLTSKIVVQH